MRFLFLSLLLLVPTSIDAGERSQQVTIDAQDKPLTELLSELSQRTGKTLIAARGINPKVTLSLRDVSWRVAVGLIAERTGCELQDLPRGGLLLTNRPKLSIEFRDASARSALLLLAKYAHKSIVISAQVRGRVSLNLRGVSPERALVAVAQLVGAQVVAAGPALWKVR